MVTRSALSVGVVLLVGVTGLRGGDAQDNSIPPRSPAAADSTEVATLLGNGASQVVVLHNESAIQGRVEKLRDRLMVSKGPWYVVRVPLADVDFIAPDFAAAYRTKRGRLSERDFPRHLQLAQWCLRHDLDRFAADQLLHLARLEPHHPAVEALEQQLRRRANANANANANASANANGSGAAREIDGVATAPSAGTPPTPALAPTVGRLLPIELPPVSPVALAEFTRSIQPLLLNRCGQTTCHGTAGQNAFQLQRLRASGVARKDLTLRNLRSAMAHIDATDIGQTSLLEHAVRPHGQGSQAPFGPHETRQYERLLHWVTRVAGGGGLRDAADAEFSLASAEQPVGPAEEGTASAADWMDSSVRDAGPPGATAIDPYDPAAFNARFSSDSADEALER